MDYERILKPQPPGGGGFSPGKLRNMLLGLEKKRKEEEEELGSIYDLRSQALQIDEAGSSGSDICKDVDVVSVLPECSTSIKADSLVSEIVSEHRLKDNAYNSRLRMQDEPSFDIDSGQDGSTLLTSTFEFQKSERSARVPLGPFSKPAPSKWDDAQKWIASPTSNRPKTGQSQTQGGHLFGSRKLGIGLGSRQPSLKVVVEVPDRKVTSFEEPDTKQIDSHEANIGSVAQKFVCWDANPCAVADSSGKPALMIENSVGESAISLSQHDSSLAIQTATTFIPPPTTARSVSMRDMGTEMTPIASQEPSRTGTPVRATTPMRSPTSSVPSTPGRGAPTSSPTTAPIEHVDTNKELSEKEIQLKTRREIVVLGTQLGKLNIAAWASKEEEEKDASTSLKTVATEQPIKSVIETRAAAWEEAEKAKYMARFKREEMKIQAWENHQKAKTEAEMRRVEVKIERMRGQAHDRLTNKLAAVRHKAEEKLAAAEAKRNRQAAIAEQQADHIRQTGRIPSLFSCFYCCS
ncbi:hypothetical protein IC582_024160 [Cucumis melo]|uniref:Flocculation protein FLO11 isoform X1 n=2 Tax=Cucumis melo TaxID=3656 RepID=A0A5D3E2X4_CUCMM|nr:uncharacterized protein LOC103499112 [Cucumis melo]KAA0035976.1 flocculation protein FLO11 isoform X1 [Cucumis melo var. makuwa]TYK30427.1 flocculation protein FLO11 isoform X1 [Cucumis melo var. makuwa]